jgi:hypothetical protein
LLQCVVKLQAHHYNDHFMFRHAPRFAHSLRDHPPVSTLLFLQKSI